MEAWIALGISAVSLAVSILTFVRGRPRVRVTGETVIMVGRGDPASKFVITATNTGGVPARIRQVSVRAIDGAYARYVTGDGEGPALPVELEANGGHRSWLVDYPEMRAEIHRTVLDSAVKVRATVTIGNRVYRQRGFTGVPQVGDTEAPRPWSKRLRHQVRSWFHPGIASIPFHTPADFDLALNTGDLHFVNAGIGVTRRLKLTLVVEHGNGERERVAGVDPVWIPRMLPRRSTVVRVPLVDDEDVAPGDHFWWLTTSGRGAGGGYEAPRVSQGRALAAAQVHRDEERRNRSQV